ncbi:glycosyltransferase [Cellulomonas chitinilytica]|uniref:glycosyltransferase n=1 Tax=Cellulomonas chitinilytica TaxID=398759 RepID=UPI0019429B2A|nr:glycosyltransferase [Cellulomonas chitinilytica]
MLVHEWLARTGGSEKVFETLAAGFPDADLLCLWNDAPDRFGTRPVRETWLGRSPLRRHKAMALPIMPFVWRGRPAGGYDWVLASTHLFAHHVSFAGPAAPKFAYVHTPARYIWNPELDARGSAWAVRAVSAPLRPLDRRRAKEPVALAANSAFVRERIAAAWDRDAVVIHPPVEVELIQGVPSWADELAADERELLDSLPGTFVLGASRFVPYKRLDLVIAAGESAGVPVVIAGSGPLRDELVQRAARATVPVRFVDAPRDALLFALYERATVYVFPPVEDFGIMPVEAMACGCPVVANREGGASESVRPGVSGELVDVASPASVRDGLVRAAALDRRRVREHAVRFRRERFIDEIRTWLSAHGAPVGGPARLDGEQER